MALDHEVVQVREETRFDRAGQPVNYKVVTFYIGKTGPYTESFLASDFTAGAVQARIQQLKTQLDLLGVK